MNDGLVFYGLKETELPDEHLRECAVCKQYAYVETFEQNRKNNETT